jgi:cinnamyl-alcohol dehydrogenase
VGGRLVACNDQTITSRANCSGVFWQKIFVTRMDVHGKNDEEQHCPKSVPTYSAKYPDGSLAYGGFASHVTAHSHFVFHIPHQLSSTGAAPLLCAGITTYSPLMFYGLNKPGMKLGVVGLGGLGHMAVRFGKALGLEVTVISTSENKRKTAKTLGADHFVVSKDEKAMLEISESLDGILDTVSAQHSISNLLGLIKPDGKLVILGVPPEPLDLHVFSIVGKRRQVAGSMIGGIGETQEMIDFCSKHNILCDVEVISADYLNTAMERLVKNDVYYRFSIDVQGTLLD